MKIKKLMLMLLASIATLTVSAHDVAVEYYGRTFYYNYINDSTELEVTYKDSNYNSYTGSIVIPSEVVINDQTYKVTRIGNSAFEKCKELTYVRIPDNITEIGYSAFYDSDKLTEISIGNGVQDIGSIAFPSNIQDVHLGDNVHDCVINEFNKHSYDSKTKTYKYSYKCHVPKGSKTLLKIWTYRAKLGDYNSKIIVDDKETTSMPYLRTGRTTQTTVRLSYYDYYSLLGDFTLKWECYDHEYETIDNETIEVKGLYPEEYINMYLSVSLDDVEYKCKLQKDQKTVSLSPSIGLHSSTANSITLSGTYTKGDANVTSEYIWVDGKEYEGNTVTISGLQPRESIKAYYGIYVDDKKRYYRSTTQEFSTSKVEFKTEQPKVVSLGNVVVAAQTNIDETEDNVGFEWRRTDWSDDFASNSGQAVIYNGMMEGYIRNLNTEKLWKFRPYYIDANDKYYYGGWVGVDPTNTSFFEPTVHTYAKIDVSENQATLNGYVMNGTENITEQGFEYWINKSTSSNAYFAPSDGSIQTVQATGQRMTATIQNLEEGRTYCYRAYAKTTSKTVYGEELQFETPNPAGIQDVSDTSEAKDIVGVYNLHGHKLDYPQNGINIIRYSDGSTKKVLISK